MLYISPILLYFEFDNKFKPIFQNIYCEPTNIFEASDIANNENLRMKYFSSSLTKNAFTWYTTLPSGSIFTWSQLEKVFHEQFYMGNLRLVSKNWLVFDVKRLNLLIII